MSPHASSRARHLGIQKAVDGVLRLPPRDRGAVRVTRAIERDSSVDEPQTLLPCIHGVAAAATARRMHMVVATHPSIAALAESACPGPPPLDPVPIRGHHGPSVNGESVAAAR